MEYPDRPFYERCVISPIFWCLQNIKAWKTYLWQKGRPGRDIWPSLQLDCYSRWKARKILIPRPGKGISDLNEIPSFLTKFIFISLEYFYESANFLWNVPLLGIEPNAAGITWEFGFTSKLTPPSLFSCSDLLSASTQVHIDHKFLFISYHVSLPSFTVRYRLAI